MNAFVLLALLVLPIIGVAMFLKVNAAVMYMSLCVGQVLVQYIANDTVTVVTSTSSRVSAANVSSIKLVLLLLPVVATAIFMFHSVYGKSWVLNLLPAIGSGLLAAIFVKPLLSTSFQRTLNNSTIWHQIIQSQTAIIAIGSFVALFYLWSESRGRRSHRSHSTEHHHA